MASDVGVGGSVISVGNPLPVGQVVTRASEDASLLAGNATRNGATRAAGSSSKFRAFASADQAGTLSIQQSPDGGTTWYTTLTQAVAANTPTILESIVTLPHVRAQFANGASAQGAFAFASALVGF